MKQDEWDEGFDDDEREVNDEDTYGDDDGQDENTHSDDWEDTEDERD